MGNYPPINQQCKKLFWDLIIKYDNVFPEFADALNQCILGNINDNNLKIIRNYEFSNNLDIKDQKQLINDLNWYFDYVIWQDIYCQTSEYLEENDYWDRLRL